MSNAKQANQLAAGAAPSMRRDRLIRLPDVEAVTGFKKSTIYLLLKQGKFPKPVRLSARMVAWSDQSVQDWVRARIEEGAEE